MIAALGHIARHGRIGLVLGLLAGVLLPDVALMLRPWLPEMIGLLLFLTALRIGATQAVGSIGALGQSAKIVLVYQVVLPVLAFGAFWLFGLAATPVALIVVLALSAPPITGSPNFTLLLGHDPAPALRLLVLGMAVAGSGQRWGRVCRLGMADGSDRGIGRRGFCRAAGVFPCPETRCDRGD